MKYEHVLLFGTTNAKTELNNCLNKDLHFKDIEIDIESADKMTDNQQVAFVKNVLITHRILKAPSLIKLNIK